MEANVSSVYPSIRSARFGSISSGTLRTEDLLDAFAYELEYHVQHNAEAWCSDEGRVARDSYMRAIGEAREVEDYDSESASEMVSGLCDLLTEFAPAYGYFGSHEGDGADFGYWLSSSFSEDFDGLKVSDLADIPDDYEGEALVINDHGNMSLYSVSGQKATEVWSVV